MKSSVLRSSVHACGRERFVKESYFGSDIKGDGAVRFWQRDRTDCPSCGPVPSGSIALASGMPAHATRLREMATECRDLASVAHTREIREQLLEVAEQFERLARHREFIRMTTPPGLRSSGH